MRKPKLTYANVVSTLCLFVLLGGSAYAANRYLITSTSQIKPSVLAQISGPGDAAAAKKKKQKRGPPGPQGPTGPVGPGGVAGTARAYALVTGNTFFPCSTNCNLATAYTKGVSNATHASMGIYCVNAPGIDRTTTPALVQVAANGTTNPGTAAATIETNAPDCTAGFEVKTYDATTLSDGVSFFILFP
jgi:hypothetical protein